MIVIPRVVLRAALSAFVLIPLTAAAQQSPPAAIGELQAPDDLGPFQRRIAPQLLRATGEVRVWVQLQDSPLAAVNADAKERGLPITAGSQRAWLGQLRDEHDALSYAASTLGGRELGRVSKAHNAVAFAIDARNLAALAAQPGVLAIRPVIDYSIELSETVPYIGATAVQNLGFTGEGVRIAVLDSGIDYTHRNLGGAGTAAAYTAAFGSSLDDPRNTTINPALFPTDKVVGGFDFVGEHWPSGDPRCGFSDPPTNKVPKVCLVPDPNPIACGGVGGCDGTHGTHVSDIIGGRSNDGAHVGVAPGAQLYAVKVCSSVSTSCSGVALLQGMEFAVDPNGDGDLSDHVDVINMSLGSNYGQVEDDLTLASENAARLGVVVAVAAGNAADKPYIVSSPSIAPGAISVAQTQVPSAKFFPLKVNSPASIAGNYNNTATVTWAPIVHGFTGDVAFVGRGCPAGTVSPTAPADAYLADPAGKVALIDRGACSISDKVDRAARAGAIGVLIGLVASGDAVTFSQGGGSQFVETLVITQAHANVLKGALASNVVNVTVHDSQSLARSMASTSARGPSISYQTVKPEIGAPGASVSAVAGSATGESPFGGTSGATPMIAGSAALLLERYPQASPFEIKARLMNTAETAISTAPNLLPGQIAPVSRIGAGEVRVDKAMAANTFALSLENESAAVSFGYAALDEVRTFNRKVLVFNRSASSRTYNVTTSFRDPSNPANAAATLRVPSTLRVSRGGVGVLEVRLTVDPSNPANAAATLRVPSTLRVSRGGVGVLEVRLTVDPSKLNTWNINGGPLGGNGQVLNGLELDGEITLSDAQDTIHVPWHMLPHKAADVSSADDDIDLSDDGTGTGTLTGTVTLRNTGVASGRVDVFAWTGTSKKISRRLLPHPGDNFAVIDLGKVGVRQAMAGTTPVVQFAISTFGKRATPNYPAEFDIYIDANRDGVPDFVVFNLENGGFGATGQNVVSVADIRARPAGAPPAPAPGIVSYTDADLDSANVIMAAPLAALAPITVTGTAGPVTLPGLSATSQFDFSIYAFDNYFTGNLTDAIENMTFSFAAPRLAASGVPAAVAPGASATFTVSAAPGWDTASPSQKGLLLLYRDAANREAQGLKADTGSDRD